MVNKKATTAAEKLSLFAITWPIFIEFLLHMLMGNADTLMLSQYSDHSVAAVGLTNQILSIVIVMFGFIATGTSVVIAQAVGAKNFKSAEETIIVSLAANLVFGALLSASLYLFGGVFLTWVQTPPELMSEAKSYLYIVGGFSFIQAVIMTIGASLRSYGFTKDAMNVTIGMNVLNVIGNYLFIFGPFGIPVLGVEGVAISTSVSRMAGLAILLVLLKKRTNISLDLRRAASVPIKHLKNVLRIGLPAAGEHLSYSTSQMVITIFITMIGTQALTAKVYAFNIMMFIFLFSVSIGQGTQIIVGQMIGAKKLDEAYETCLRSLKYSMFITFGMSIIVAFSAKPLLSIFTNNPAILSVGAVLLALTVVLEPGRSFNLVVISSLRAAGDAKFPVYMGVLSMWGMSVPLSYILGISMGFGLIGIFIAFIADEWLRGLLMLRRWKQRGWQENRMAA
ncbi:MATE family efflux transporter [Fictibacillus iocasae]|uniref:MATE family efflux transporter n=1 Tax=Fictibacillus iocasae TaxID=2715437 RepID=A0ABW2NPM2_9BACL